MNLSLKLNINSHRHTYIDITHISMCTDNIHVLTRTEMKAFFIFIFRGHPVASALQIIEIPLKYVPGFKGAAMGKGEQGMSLCYLGFGTLFFFLTSSSPHHQNIYFFSVCIKCQVNFLGAMRDVSSPSACVAGWLMEAVCDECQCVYIYVCLYMCASTPAKKGIRMGQSKRKDQRWLWDSEQSA